MLFNESPGRIIVEVNPEKLDMVEALFAGQPFGKIGKATNEHTNLRIEWGKETLIDEPITELKSLWKNGLVPYY